MKINEKKKPLIDNILILGLKSEELNNLQSLNVDEIENFALKFKAVILENYQSFYSPINICSDDEFCKRI